MKKIYYLLYSPLIFLVSCSSGAGDQLDPEMLGCIDECAINYDIDANIDDGTCLYSFLGFWCFDDFIVNGISLMNSIFLWK